MSWLLDTNVISEWVKPEPAPQVVKWLAEVDEDRQFLSVVNFAEIRLGIENLAPGRRRQHLSEWVETDLSSRFEGRILTVDIAVANAWGTLIVRARAKGKALSSMDALLAATATVHGLTLVTRDTADFAGAGIDLFDPWTTG